MPPAEAGAFVEHAPAKVNLTLHLLGRRPDGYHEIESLVVFARLADRLRFSPGGELALAVRGPFAAATGENADNLVLKAARALAARVEGLTLGRFVLDKNLPAAAGLGGGSADAAAALRLLARANDLAADDPRLLDAARATGADVPVCLDPRARIMRGIGELLSAPLALPTFPAVLVNPGVPVATRDAFAQLGLAPGTPARTGGCGTMASLADAGEGAAALSREALLAVLAGGRNDLEPAAIAIAPVIADALAALRACDGCLLARMSGSGATCFALLASQRTASDAARRLRAARLGWWVSATMVG